MAITVRHGVDAGLGTAVAHRGGYLKGQGSVMRQEDAQAHAVGMQQAGFAQAQSLAAQSREHAESMAAQRHEDAIERMEVNNRESRRAAISQFKLNQLAKHKDLEIQGFRWSAEDKRRKEQIEGAMRKVEGMENLSPTQREDAQNKLAIMYEGLEPNVIGKPTAKELRDEQTIIDDKTGVRMVPDGRGGTKMHEVDEAEYDIKKKQIDDRQKDRQNLRKEISDIRNNSGDATGKGRMSIEEATTEAIKRDQRIDSYLETGEDPGAKKEKPKDPAKAKDVQKLFSTALRGGKRGEKAKAVKKLGDLAAQKSISALQALHALAKNDDPEAIEILRQL